MSEDMSSHQMTVDESLPSPEEFGERIRDVVEYLQNQQGSALSGQTKGRLGILRSSLERKDFTEDSWKLELSPPWEVPLEPSKSDRTGIERTDFDNAEGYAQISGVVRVENGQFAEYSFSLCILTQEEEENRSDSEVDGEEIPCCWSETDDKWRVARRLHFDIDIGDPDDERKPMAHVQVGGKIPNKNLHSEDEDASYHYCDSPLDKPRVPYPPTDPIMILNMLIRQYPGVQSADQNSWRRKVVKSENLLRKSYCKYVSGVYTRESRDPVASHLSNGPAGD